MFQVIIHSDYSIIIQTLFIIFFSFSSKHTLFQYCFVVGVLIKAIFQLRMNYGREKINQIFTYLMNKYYYFVDLMMMNSFRQSKSSWRLLWWYSRTILSNNHGKIWLSFVKHKFGIVEELKSNEGISFSKKSAWHFMNEMRENQTKRVWNKN